MKLVFLVVGLFFGYVVHAFVDLRQNYARSVELAEANCAILALSNPEIDLEPADIDCKLIVDDDFLLTFEVNEAAELYIDCLPGAAFFRREISLRQCSLYER